MLEEHLKMYGADLQRRSSTARVSMPPPSPLTAAGEGKTKHKTSSLVFLDVDAPPKTDRKSTRLNSSHLVISYAVFCLKKKKRVEHTGVDHFQTMQEPRLVKRHRRQV